MFTLVFILGTKILLNQGSMDAETCEKSRAIAYEVWRNTPTEHTPYLTAECRPLIIF